MESLLDFLKKYSDVDITFIRDFIEIQNGDKTHEPFKIDLDVITKWLDARKDHIKETLVDSYIENIDYIVLPPNRDEIKRNGGNNKEIILLTIDCFKMLCMRSKTKNADKIRYYYLTLEKLVEIYKDDIINNQKKKIEQLENNMKKVKYPVKGAIYIIKLEDGYKLGKTGDLNKRYELYKNAHKNNPDIEYVFYTSNIDKLESCVKLILQNEEYKNRKEFYLLELVDIITTIKGCNKLITNFKCKSCKKNIDIKNLKSHINTQDQTEKVKFKYIAKKK